MFEFQLVLGLTGGFFISVQLVSNSVIVLIFLLPGSGTVTVCPASAWTTQCNECLKMKEVTIRDIFGGGEGHEFLKKA